MSQVWHGKLWCNLSASTFAYSILNSLYQQTMCYFDIYLSCVRKYIAKPEASSDILVQCFQRVLPHSRIWCMEMSFKGLDVRADGCTGMLGNVSSWDINLSGIIFCPACATGLSEGNFKLFSVWFLTDHGFLLSPVINCCFDCKCAVNCSHKYLPSSLRAGRRKLF